MLSLRRFGGVVAAALVLSVPAFAISALSNSTSTPVVAIETRDDAVAALRIVNSPAAEQARPTAAVAQSGDAVIAIQKSELTKKGSASQ
jgi:hypothetical protein